MYRLMYPTHKFLNDSINADSLFCSLLSGVRSCLVSIQENRYIREKAEYVGAKFADSTSIFYY